MERMQKVSRPVRTSSPDAPEYAASFLTRGREHDNVENPMTPLAGAPARTIVADVMSLTSRVAGAIALGSLLFVGCAGDKNGGTTPVTNTTTMDDGPKPGRGSTEADVNLTLKPNFFPPVDVAGWVCEPKSWNEKGVVLVHCIAPNGAPDLIAAMKQMPAVETAEPAK